MVDRDKAGRLLAELLACIGDLRRYRERVTPADLRTTRDLQHMVLRALYVAVQSSLDLAMHLNAEAGLGPAVSYQDAFYRLRDAGWIEPQLAARLAGWAGFRNVLAHLDACIDYDRAWDALGEVADLERFAALVEARIPPAGAL